MQRLNNALRVDAAANTTQASVQNPSRADRIVVMRTRALFAALSNQRADLLMQLLSHLGTRTFAQTLATLSAQEQVAALRMLSAERRAAVFRELTQAQREIWHKAVQAESAQKPSLLIRCKRLLRTPFANKKSQSKTA